jgi:hypothetical protein
MNRHRDFLAFVVLAMTTATPIFAQTAPDVAAASDTERRSYDSQLFRDLESSGLSLV